jgi:hypothetical protein
MEIGQSLAGSLGYSRSRQISSDPKAFLTCASTIIAPGYDNHKEERKTMKVLQTLGRHGGAQEGIFQYYRTTDGVHIDSGVGQAKLDPSTIIVTNDEWTAILGAIADAKGATFRLTGNAPFDDPPNTSLYELFTQAVPKPNGGWNWNDSWKSYICAILEHEGSIDLYHGVLGPNATAIICVSKQV